MAFLLNLKKKSDFQKAKTPLERLFYEAKWTAIENNTDDLRRYELLSEEIGKITSEMGYTSDAKEECELLIHFSKEHFQDKRFCEFLLRALNGER